jgi:hypothetical protein
MDDIAAELREAAKHTGQALLLAKRRKLRCWCQALSVQVRAIDDLASKLAKTAST